MELITNMRAAEELEFAKWLKKLGENTLRPPRGLPHGYVALDSSWMVDSLDDLIYSVFGNDPSLTGASRAIVAWTNKDVNAINHAILDKMGGATMECPSEDSIVDDVFTPTSRTVRVPQMPDAATLNPNTEWLCGQVSLDDLNRLHPPGSPPHMLKLRPGAILMILRNLDVERGLCNGTRVRLINATRQVRSSDIAWNPPVAIKFFQLLTCYVVSGPSTGATVYIPRIDMIFAASNTLKMRRIQFPVRLAWCGTVEKMQGQTLDAVGVYMPRHNFIHGKLYVALSRVRSSKNIKMYIIPDQHQGVHNGIHYTRNVVDRQLWDLSLPRLLPFSAVPAFIPDYFLGDDDEDDSTPPTVAVLFIPCYVAFFNILFLMVIL
jgi:ATP-dependent DNA helicase PIF1